MVFFNKIRDFFAALEERTFYYYIAGFLGAIFLFSVGVTYYTYDSTTALVSDIEAINEERESKIKKILQKGLRIKNKQKEMDRMLSEDKNFKIVEEFNKLSQRLNLGAAKTETSQSDLDDKYQEITLAINFASDITMKQLLELLQAIEKVERIYTKHLDIVKSKKSENSLDVKLVIATLLPKITETD